MNNKWIVGVALLVVVGLIVAARVSQRDDSPPTVPGQQSAVRQQGDTANVAGELVGGDAEEAGQVNLAPDFSLQTLEGQTITLADYRGEKAVVLDFWATWCPNCQRDMPVLNKLYNEYQGEVEVIGINLQEKTDKVQKFVEQRGINFPVVLDPTASVSRSYGVQYTNTHILIGKDGALVKIVPGDIKESDIKLLIEAS